MTDWTDSDHSPSASFVPFLDDLLRSARAGWRPKYLLLAWLAVLPCYALQTLWLSRLSSPGWGVLVLAGLACVGVGVIAILLFGMIAGSSGWEYGRGCHWTLRESISMLRARFSCLILSVLVLPLAVAMLFAIVTLGAWLLGRFNVLGIGTALTWMWLVLVGLPFALMGAGLVVLGLPALLLALPAAVLDCRESFEAVSRAMSYVRGRPLKYFVCLLVNQIAAAFSAAVFAVFFFVVLAFLSIAYRIGHDLEFPVLAWSQFTGPIREIGFFCPCWNSGATTLASAWFLGALACLVTASYLAASLAGLSRIYLYLRFDLDQELPSSLVHVTETFEWADGREQTE